MAGGRESSGFHRRAVFKETTNGSNEEMTDSHYPAPVQPGVVRPVAEIDLPGIRLEHDAFGRLVLIDGSGRRFAGLVPVRCFPFSAPEKWVSLCDEHGREVVCIADLNLISEQARQVLVQEISQRDFIPVIVKVDSIEPENEPSTWEVVTDRGPTRFVLHSEDHIRRMGEGALIVDVHGIRFHIPRIESLDLHSRKLLRRYL